jgi:hypothetical protein
MQRLVGFLPALVLLVLAGALLLLGHNPLLRMVGVGAVMTSVYLVRRAQVASARQTVRAEGASSDRSRRVLVWAVVLLLASLAAFGYCLISGIAASSFGPRIMFVLAGFSLALLAGIANYLWSRRITLRDR